MLEYVIPSCIGCTTLFYFGVSYKFLKDYSNSAASNKAIITLLTLLLTLLTTIIMLIFFDINLISMRLFETHSFYILVSLSLINLTCFIIVPYIYFFLESLNNTAEEAKDLNSTESCNIYYLSLIFNI